MAGNSDIPEWAEVIKALVEGEIAELHTAAPATVVLFDPLRQAVTVSLATVGRVDDVLLDVERPDAPALPIPNAPVVFASGGGPAAGWSIVGPLFPGDPVTVIFAERSTDEWRTAGAPVNVPLDARRHDYTDALAFPGGRSLAPPGSLPTAPLPPTAFDPLRLVIRSDVGVALGSSLAVQPLIKGIIFEADFATWLASFSTWLTATTTFAAVVTTPPIGAPPTLVQITAWITAVNIAAGLWVTATGTLAAATTTFTATVTGGAHLSTKVFTE